MTYSGAIIGNEASKNPCFRGFQEHFCWRLWRPASAFKIYSKGCNSKFRDNATVLFSYLHIGFLTFLALLKNYFWDGSPCKHNSQPAEGRLRPKIIDGGRSGYVPRNLGTIGNFFRPKYRSGYVPRNLGTISNLFHPKYRTICSTKFHPN